MTAVILRIGGVIALFGDAGDNSLTAGVGVVRRFPVTGAEENRGLHASVEAAEVIHDTGVEDLQALHALSVVNVHRVVLDVYKRQM